MILAIGSLGEGAPRRRTKLAMAAAHLAGGAIGGCAAIAVVWLAATPVRTLLPQAVAIVLLVPIVAWALSVDLGHTLKSSARGRQVQSTWLKHRGPIVGFALYGAKLGAGLLTYVPFAVTYAMFAAAALLLSGPAALACGALFGAARACAVTVGALRAEAASQILFRRRGSRRLYLAVSVAASIAIIVDTFAVSVL